ncbi:transcription factor bHLH30-like [Oryza brachyantha]|uniref:transcription factor bHLH30-like n=1 Tax=Oryza brachyantha TaxID=4533 RepID=UPI001AD9A80B|nr:transcription factor bHLH30-like [Oryza brachyantha]
MGSAPFGDAAAAGRLYDFQGYHGGGHGPYGVRQPQPGRASASSVFFDDGETDGMDAAAAADMDMPRKDCGGDRDEKAAMALKSHSEAERRRRERINAHLATLRTMVPCTDKMDKAALLAEVVSHVRKLKSAAARVGRCSPVPSGADEVAVEAVQEASASGRGGGGGDTPVLLRATLSCDDRADLFVDVKRALQPLGLEVVGSEVTTLGGRVRLTFLVSCGPRAAAAAAMASVREALQSVLDKASSGFDFAPRTSLLSKRRKVSTFESSSSSS